MFPLTCFTELDHINKALSESPGYETVSFQWIELERFVNEIIGESDINQLTLLRPRR